ncbi:hypothetical protein [Amycolatopsis dongchuanensis]|uniref:Uncharacterized protein n=1 Tax=Amycolatopsis dongchuanensis TaxID=1070866 RepID=A0ABP9QHS9_9PSEU
MTRIGAQEPGRFQDRRGSAADTSTATAPAPRAEQSWQIFGLGVVQWLGGQQSGVDLGTAAPRFGLFLDVLLRGLPARTPVEHPRC